MHNSYAQAILIRLLLWTCLFFSAQLLAQDEDNQQAESSQPKQGSKLLQSLGIGGKEKTQPENETASESEIIGAFRQALRIGSGHVVQQLGQEDGYLLDDVAHIALPKSLQKVHKTLSKFGLGDVTDELEISMNRAAEQATPLAADLFYQAIEDMRFEDIVEIYRGPDDSATRYFETQMTEPLKLAMRPIVENSLSEVGAIQLYDQAISSYEDLPFAPKVKGDLTEHVLSSSLNGIFHYLAIQEQSIRQDPLKQTTSLLKKVFGQ